MSSERVKVRCGSRANTVNRLNSVDVRASSLPPTTASRFKKSNIKSFSKTIESYESSLNDFIQKYISDSDMTELDKNYSRDNNPRIFTRIEDVDHIVNNCDELFHFRKDLPDIVGAIRENYYSGNNRSFSNPFRAESADSSSSKTKKLHSI